MYKPILVTALIYPLLLLSLPGRADEVPINDSSALELEIQSQPMEDALNALAQQSGIQVVFYSGIASDIQSRPVAGRFRNERAALDYLLPGTGLTYKYINERTVAVSANNSVEDQDSGKSRPASNTLLVAQAGTSAQSSGEINSTAGKSERREKMIEEMIVTAQKREESLLDVPVPVTALQASTLGDQSQYRIQDYYSMIPGLSIGSSELAPTLAIRGIIASAGSNPTVSVILDDLPLGSATAIGGGYFAPELDPADLARIEVLRGPQGTLYGASSVGGLLKYVTVDPSVDAFDGRIQLGANTVALGGDGYNASGSVNVPISDTFALRISGFDRHEAGYIDNVRPGSGKDINEADLSGGRVSALWTPTDELSIKLAALYQKNKLSGYAYVTHETPPLGDLKQNFLPNTGTSERTFKAYSADIRYRTDAYEVVSITGYTESLYEDILDYSDGFGDLTDFFLGTPNAVDFDNSKTFKVTQEIRFSTTFFDKLDWLVGGYYGDERSPYLFQLVGADDNGAMIGSSSLLLADYESTLTEKSIFTNFTYRFSDKFDVQFGGRKAYIRQSFEEVDSGLLFEPFSPLITPKESFDEDATTYLLTPRYKISDNAMAYVRIASGYRPGGVNVAGIGGAGSYAPDTTWNYEFGIKGSARNGALTYDASLYRIDWSDIQLTVLTEDGGGYFVNGGEAQSQGLELALDAALTSQLTLSGWIALTDATITQDMPEGAAHGLKGDRLPYSAKFTTHVAAEYDFSIAGRDAYVGADVSYVGDRVADFLTAEEMREQFDSYTEWNLTAGMMLERWAFDLYLSNVTDERGVTGGGAGSTIPRAFQVIQPRTFGVSLSRSFE